MFNYANTSDEALQVLVKKKDWLASLPKHDTTEGIYNGNFITGPYWNEQYFPQTCLFGTLRAWIISAVETG